jgi:hypothetical protein
VENTINNPYLVGDYVYIERSGVKYYFVCKKDIPIGLVIPPPNPDYWISDLCSKTLRGCKLRWGVDSTGSPAPGKNPLIGGNPHNGALPFGGFPAVNKAK